MKQLTTVRSLSAIIVLFLLTALSASAQTHTPKSVYINDKIKGFWEYLPEGYNASSSQTYPLIISFHGAGERGSGSTTDLNKVLIHGVPKMIKNGTFPKSFTVNNETHRFIVLSPQLVDVATALQVNEFLDYAIRNYRVDPTRIYLTGLSMGGGMQYLYMGLYSAHAQRVAAMVPICEAYGYDVRIAQNIAKNGVAVWGLTNKTDNVVSPSLTINYINAINANNPVHRARLTVFDASGHDAWSRVYDVNYRENGMNIFEWMLQYKKGSTTTPTNQAPTANAGTDKNITLPTSSVSMTASASDADGTIASYSWSQVSGPASASFSSTTVLNPTISNLVAGTYTFRLTVKDNAGATKTDDVIVTVNNAPVNEAPSAYAGGDKKLYLPTNSTLMTSTASDADGTITAYNWSKVAGPSSYSFSSTTTLKPTVSNLTPGTYTFRLTVTDNAGAAVSDDVNIVVEDTTQATNEAPAANAGSDKSITLPANSTTLSGSGTDADGSIASYTWTKVSGPASGTIGNATSASATLSNLEEGTYTFRLTVKDNDGATDTDDVVVVVNPSLSDNVSVKSINVNIYGGSNAYNHSAWNNWNVGAGTNRTSSNFTYSDGTSSSVSAVLSHSQAVTDNGSAYGSSSSMAPASVLRYTSYSTVNRTLTIKGLSSAKTYTIELYASRASNGNSTAFANSTQKVTVNTSNNMTNKAVLSNLRPDASGNIVISMTRVNTFLYLNGFAITESASTSSSALSSNSLSNKVVEESASGNGLEVYPNPITDRFSLKISSAYTGNVNVQLVDMNGSVVKSYSIAKDGTAATTVYLSASGVAAGTYVLRAQLGTEVLTQKIVKQ